MGSEPVTIQQLGPSPNRNKRPAVPLRAIIIHDTGGSTLAGAVSWCLNPASNVSYHYIVDLDGSIVQLVPESERAWHAGRAAYPGEDESDVNGTSIGVAMVNDGAKPYPDAQVRATAELCSAILLRNWGFSLEPERIFGHAAVAIPKGRKNDPHALFPWERFAELVADLEPPRPILRRGARGPEVRRLQELLNAVPILKVDGQFGARTHDALAEFITDHVPSQPLSQVETTPEVWQALERAASKPGGGT